MARNAVHSDPVHEEAARWFTRLQAAELPIDETVEWQRWINADPRHAEAFQRLDEVWQGLGLLPRPALLPRALVEADTYDGSTPVSEWNALRKKARSRRRTAFLALAASLVAITTALATLWAWNAAATEVLETRVGENRSLTLADGSRVSLGGHTRVDVNLRADDRREIILVRGEALFNVARDPKRPFSVLAGAAEVTAVGTAFNVRRTDDRVVVSVLEGRVRIQPMRTVIPLEEIPVQLPWIEEFSPAVARGESKHLDAGHRTMVDRNGTTDTAELPNPGAATAWQQGRLAFEDDALRDVVDVVNRYSAKPIVIAEPAIAEPAIAELRFSGTVVSDHVEGWIASLNTAFGIRATEHPDEIRLEPARER